MNSTNISLTTVSNEELQHILEYLDWQQFVDQDIPVVVLLGLFCVFGVVGNSHAIAVFRRYTDSSVTFLLKWMVHVDLITCCICIPLEIVQIRFTYLYPSPALCKITRYLTHFTSLASGILLLVVAIERRQKICAPFGWQLSFNKAKLVAVLVVAFAAVLAIPAGIFYDVFKKEVSGISGKDCRDTKGISQAKIYAILVMAFIFLGFLVCSASYIQIVNVIRSQLKAEKGRRLSFRGGETPQSRSRAASVSSYIRSVNRYHESSDGGRAKRSSVKSCQLALSLSDMSANKITNESQSYALNKDRESLKGYTLKEQRYKESRIMTIMILIATGVSFIGYILHFSAVILRTTLGSDTTEKIKPVYSMLVRGYFIHSAVHPLVYGVVNRKFRTECRKLYSDIFQKLVKTKNKP